jgi:hypothetical protein
MGQQVRGGWAFLVFDCEALFKEVAEAFIACKQRFVVLATFRLTHQQVPFIHHQIAQWR